MCKRFALTSNEYFNEIDRLNQELLEERRKTSQLESDLTSLKKKFVDFEQKYCQMPKPNLQTNKTDSKAQETSLPQQFRSVHSVNGSQNKRNNNLCIESIK